MIHVACSFAALKRPVRSTIAIVEGATHPVVGLLRNPSDFDATVMIS